jgi:riboflavin kinase/FMN adenylyltransferase
LIGTVIVGRGLGRALGAPTANIALPTARPSSYGSYAAIVVVRGCARAALAHVGVRPSIGGTEPLLEVHLLDFEGDLYGLTMHVRLLRKVSDERALASLASLRRKIADDIRRVRAFFRRGC